LAALHQRASDSLKQKLAAFLQKSKDGESEAAVADVDRWRAPPITAFRASTELIRPAWQANMLTLNNGCVDIAGDKRWRRKHCSVHTRHKH
jgi:hypothetical protein